MSDYLNHVVARSLNRVETVQPRLASRFESLTSFTGSVAEQAASWEPVAISATSDEIELTQQPETPASTIPPIQRSPATNPQTLPIQHLPQPSNLTPLSDRQVHQLPIETFPQTPETNSNSSSRRLPPAPELIESSIQEPPDRQPLTPILKHQTQTPLADSFAAQPNQLVPESAVIQPSVSQQDIPRVPRAVARRTTAPQPLVPSPRTQTQRTTAPQPLVPSPRTLSTSITDLVAPVTPSSELSSATTAVSKQQRTTSETPQPSPTIQVTIGRIEVRATPPASPPKRKRTAPVVMSLDEYLRQQH